jgi:hypothetical protein
VRWGSAGAISLTPSLKYSCLLRRSLTHIFIGMEKIYKYYLFEV